MRTKQELLDTIEQQTLIVAGELAMHKAGYMPRQSMMEDALGEIIKATLELKKIEGIPSNLSIVEEV